MSDPKVDFALPFLLRKQKNLAYFKRYRPEIYDFFENFEPRRCELVITPGKSDVDLTDSGKSIYRGISKEYSEAEVDRFLSENPPENLIKTLPPPRVSDAKIKKADRFAYRALKKSVGGLKRASNPFQGYSCGSVYPCIIFLGCGLGYHIEKLINSAEILDVVVFEPDPERFALSLFTVDWEGICKKFRGKGRSISFSIATRLDRPHFKRIIGGKLGEMVPLYPYVSRYYNHLADIELHASVKELERDIHVVAANWTDYDFELFPYRNSFHNLRQPLKLFLPRSAYETDYPLVVCGSGPSLDKRAESLARVRDKVVIVSAGTGLRALLSHGIRPDYHVEIDPTHLIYELLLEVSEDFGLEGITLIHGVTVNPLVPRLFESSISFWSASNYIPALFGQWDKAIEGASATCTNAALALSLAYGARKIYLFGTDYGFEDEGRTHSRVSVYGEESNTPKSDHLRGARQSSNKIIFPVKGVEGKTVYTRGDYLAAKQTVEHLVSDVRPHSESLSIRNCSDGADISGVPWVSSHDFVEKVEGLSMPSGDKLIRFEVCAVETSPFPVHERYSLVAAEVKELASGLMRVLRHSSLSGKRDLLVLSNEIRVMVNRVGQGSGRKAEVPVQLTAWGIVKGVVLQFVQVAITYGLSQEEEDLEPFAKHWKDAFKSFLYALPEHFASAMLNECSVEEDPLVLTTFKEDERVV